VTDDEKDEKDETPAEPDPSADEETPPEESAEDASDEDPPKAERKRRARAERPPRAPRDRPGPAAVAGGLALALVALNLGGVVVALPAIQSELDASFRDLVWVQMAFLLGIAVVFPLGPSLAGSIGRRPAALLGAFALGAGAALPIIATTPELVIAGRALQGAGAGLLLTTLAPQGAIFVGGLALAPVVGGVLVKALDWEWLFWVQVPLAVGLLILVLRDRADEARPAPFDRLGSAAYAVGLTGVVVALMQLDDWSWKVVLGVGVAGLLGLAALVPLDRRTAPSVVDFRPFRDRPFLAAAISGAVIAGAFWAVLLLEAQNLQDLFGHDALESGLILLPLTLPLLLSGLLRDRVDDPTLMIGALVVGVGGLAILGLIDKTDDDFRVVPGLLLVGLGVMGAAAALPGLAAARLPLIDTSRRTTAAARRTSASRSTGRSTAEREGRPTSRPGGGKRTGAKHGDTPRGRVGAKEAAAAKKRREEREKAARKEARHHHEDESPAEETGGAKRGRRGRPGKGDEEEPEVTTPEGRPEPGALEWSRIAGGTLVFAAISSLFLNLYANRKSEVTPSASEGGPGPNTQLDGVLAGSSDVAHRLSEFAVAVRFAVELAIRDALAYASGRALFLGAAMLLAAALLMWRLGPPSSQPEPERDDPRHRRFPL
jgi:hypothetical protein